MFLGICNQMSSVGLAYVRILGGDNYSTVVFVDHPAKVRRLTILTSTIVHYRAYLFTKISSIRTTRSVLAFSRGSSAIRRGSKSATFSSESMNRVCANNLLTCSSSTLHNSRFPVSTSE